MHTIKIKTKHLCVVDLEATCWREKKPEGPYLVNEIIEIGAVMVLANSLETVGEFQAFIRPELNPKLSDFCTELTSITQKDIDDAHGFPHVVKDFSAWIDSYGRGGVLMASQGMYDYHQMHRDCSYHRVPFPFRGDHLNLKEHHSNRLGIKKGLGQQKMLRRLQIELEGTAHRGIDDARMAVKILQKVGYAGQDGYWYRATEDEVMNVFLRRVLSKKLMPK